MITLLSCSRSHSQAALQRHLVFKAAQTSIHDSKKQIIKQWLNPATYFFLSLTSFQYFPLLCQGKRTRCSENKTTIGTTFEDSNQELTICLPSQSEPGVATLTRNKNNELGEACIMHCRRLKGFRYVTTIIIIPTRSLHNG